MTKGKLKNLILLLLAVTNGLLLWLAMPLIYQENRQKEAETTQLSTLFSQYNVTFNTDDLPQVCTLYPVELAAESQDYAAIAQRILGGDVVLHLDSGQQTQVFTGEQGVCSLSRDTAFSVDFFTLEPTENPEEQVSEILTRMAIQGQLSPGVLQDDGSMVISVVQTLFDMPYFSSKLEFVFEGNTLTHCSGNAIFDTAGFTRPDESQSIGYVDALVAFFAKRTDLGWVGSSISQVSQGFYRTDLASANLVRLTPGWKITTDTGEFWVNGLSGQVSSLEISP